jgi:hypothetical protein
MESTLFLKMYIANRLNNIENKKSILIESDHGKKEWFEGMSE